MFLYKHYIEALFLVIHTRKYGRHLRRLNSNGTTHGTFDVLPNVILTIIRHNIR